MSNLDLGFLSDLSVTPAEEFVKTKKGTASTSAIPIDGDFRMHRNGTISYAPDFKEKVGDKWLDFVFSKDWLQYPADKPSIAFININHEEKPAKADVKKEGSSVYVKERFLELASELWGINWEMRSFIDFKVEEQEVKIPIALLPKVVQRGADKGNADYVKRENCVLMPITPSLTEEDYADMAQGSQDLDPSDDMPQEEVVDNGEETGDEVVAEENPFPEAEV